MKGMNMKAERGFTLVEALVALLVLSIGLLGVAGLQLTALRNNNSASYRSQATYLAYDIADRMRANRADALDGNYNLELDADPAEAPTTRADLDLAAWIAMLEATLPAGDGAIELIDGENTIEITIRWDDTKGVGEMGADEDAEEKRTIFVTRTWI